jgi:hypothetical protein
MQDCIEEASEVISLPYELKKYHPTHSLDRGLIIHHNTIPLFNFARLFYNNFLYKLYSLYLQQQL